MVFAQELASRLRVFKLILLDRGGGLVAETGERMSFVEARRSARAHRRAATRLRSKMVRLASDAIRDGVGTVNLGFAAMGLRGAVQLQRSRHAVHPGAVRHRFADIDR